MYSPRSFPRPPAAVLLIACALLGCAANPGSVVDPPPIEPPGPDTRCGLVVTDDDIPSGSATAGAMFVPDAATGRSLLTEDVLAVARAFRANGVPCVDALDSHDGALDPAPLAAEGVRLLIPSNSARWTWPFLGPMDRRYAAAALVGFHSDAGQRGFRAHTINDWVAGLEIDGQPAGEVAHLVLGLSAFQVPVVLVTGDMNATVQAQRLLPSVGVVTVRWLEPDGTTGFLDQARAAERIHAEVRRALAEQPGLPPAARPVQVRIAATNLRLLADRASGMGGAWKQVLETEGLGARRFSELVFSRVGDKWLAWQAPDALTAFLSIAFAAHHLKAADTWELVSRGYSAYKAGDHANAIQAYQEALEQNPYDTATRCRLGGALLAAGRTTEARVHFAYGVEHEDEIGDEAIRSWCRRGLAEAEQALGGFNASMLPLCLEVLAGGRDAEPRLAAHPLVAKMSAGMREQIQFDPEEFARAAFSGGPDERFSWNRLRQNKAFVEPFVAAVRARQAELVGAALERASEFLPDRIVPSEVRLNLVCGSPWDAFVLIFDGPEVFFDLGFYADAPPEQAIPEFEAILTHELWHQAFLKHQDRHWTAKYRDDGSVRTQFIYRMINEGVGHYYSMHSKLLPKPAWSDFAERERRAFALLAEKYPSYRDEPDEKRRRDILWRSHAGVPFWEKWSAVPGALVVYHLASVVDPGGLRELIVRDPFSCIVEYERLCGEHPEWPRLPERLVQDARAERGQK